MESPRRLRLPLTLTTAALTLALGLSGCAGTVPGPAPSSSADAADPAPEESREPLSNARAAAQGEDPAASARASIQAEREAAEREGPRYAVVDVPAALFTEGEGGLTFEAWARTTDVWQAEEWDPEAEPVVAEAIVPAERDPVSRPGALTVPVSGPGEVHRVVLLCEHGSPVPESDTSGVDVVAGQTYLVIGTGPRCSPIDVRYTVAAEHIVDGAIRYEFGVAAGEAGRLAVMKGR